MTTEPGEADQVPARRRSGLWGGIAVTTGAAFAIIAVLHAPGIAYVLVAIVAGLAYSLATMYCRRGG